MKQKLLAAVIMGSVSDAPVMKKACDVLKEFGVRHLTAVLSAHRSPRRLRSFIAQVEKSGVQVYIAGAGKAAHLAGAVASQTSRPVIGVPLGSKLLGLDSLLSTVQMPDGVPVATVAIDGAVNAALLAVEILSLKDRRLYNLLVDRRRAMEIGTRKK